MHLFVCEFGYTCTMHNLKTMFKLIAIDLMLLLVNFSYELVQQKCSDIASLGPGQ